MCIESQTLLLLRRLHFQSSAELLYKQAASLLSYSCCCCCYPWGFSLYSIRFFKKVKGKGKGKMSSPASFDLTSPRLKKTIKLRFLFNGHVHAQTFDCGDPGPPPKSAPPTTTPSTSQFRYVSPLSLLDDRFTFLNSINLS